MSSVRVLVGTRKGAFILTSDGKREKWDVSGPHFAGWEIYHMKGSPADPESHLRVAVERLVRAGDAALERRRQDVGAGRQQVRVRRAHRARTSGTTARRIRGSSSACGTSSRRSTIRTPCTRASRTPRSSRRRTAAQNWAELPGLRGHGTGPNWHARRRRHVPAHDPARSQRSEADVHRDLRGRRVPHATTAARLEADQQGTALAVHSRSRRRGRALRASHRDAPVAAERRSSCRSTGT